MAHTTLGRIGQAALTGFPVPRSGFLRFLEGTWEAFFDPEAVDALVVGPPPAFFASTAPRRQPQRTFAPSEVPQPGSKCQLVIGGNRGRETLGAPRRAHHPTRPALTYPEALLEQLNRCSSALRGQKFPRFNSSHRVDVKGLVRHDALETLVLLLELL